jgi:hypothetical protein
MGFNYAVFGYSSAKEVFDNFSKGESLQLEGFKTFILKQVSYDDETTYKTLREAVQNNNYTDIALIYNGSLSYAKRIQENYSLVAAVR